MLRRRQLGEHDRALAILTLEEGRMEAIARGARKAGSRLTGISEPLFRARMTLVRTKKNYYVTQAQPLQSFRKLREDYERLSFALAVTELFAEVLPEHHAEPTAYDLLLKTMEALETHEKPYCVSCWCQMKLMQITGYQPVLGESVVTGEPIRQANALVSPEAGGYLEPDNAGQYRDKFLVKAEVLNILSKLPSLEEPPPNFKFGTECLQAIFPFWVHIIHKRLPANEALLAELRSDENQRVQ
ncbi:MAG: DNA repair protein RecO [Armatimonadetes bacterium]|nr:DNA repair protein RecO [Armatimonadota bacterium]